MRRDEREIVYVERGDSSVKWLLWGALLGGGLALLYAPKSGEETRRSLQKRLRKLRAMTEEKLDELVQQVKGPGRAPAADLLGEEFDDDDDAPDVAGADGPPSRAVPSARDELERRLADARSRRRAAAGAEEGRG